MNAAYMEYTHLPVVEIPSLHVYMYLYLGITCRRRTDCFFNCTNIGKRNENFFDRLGILIPIIHVQWPSISLV